MVDSTLRSDATLPELLTLRARHASSRRLTLDVAGGALAAAAALVWRPVGWVLLLCAAGCFLAFGGWGLADRAIERVDAASRPLDARPADAVRQGALELVRGLAALLGTVAAIGLVLAAVAGGIGRVIS